MSNEYSDEYVELIETAKDAVRELLMATEPGTGLGLHSAYNTLKAMHEKGTTPQTTTSHGDRERQMWAARHEEWAAAREGWTQLSLPERERLVIETIGEGKVPIRELLSKWNERPDMSSIHYSDVYPTVRALYKAGELDRSIERVKNTQRTCQHYFRKAKLAGPIVDLERTFHEQGEDA